MQSLQNYFIIATPTLHDTFWADSVIYVCDYGHKEGALGFMISQPSTEITFNEVVKELEIPARDCSQNQPIILNGGPLESHRGFVLHDDGYSHESTLHLAPRIHLTATTEIISKIAKGTAPKNFNFCLGYAGWDAGQLEEEIAENSWLMVEADPKILYNIPATKRHQACLDKLGIDRERISMVAGHA